jgi:type II secretory pathway pseudopilin PulG
LIELLVVIAIIAVLAALTIGASMRVMDSQKEANTQTLLQTLNKVLQAQVSKVVADAKKENPSAQALALAGNDPMRARVIWIKLRLMEAFPVSFSEITAQPLYNLPTPQSPWIPSTSQQKYLATYKTMLGGALANTGSDTQSSACLLAALSINRGGVVLNPDSVAANVADLDNDSAKEIVDGWGTPVVFYRFPTPIANPSGTPATSSFPAGMDLQSNNPAAKLTASGTTPKGVRFADPVDPDGTLTNSTWYSANGPNFTGLVHPVFYPNSAPNLIVPTNPAGLPVAYYVIPVIVSAGANGTFVPGSNTITGLGLVRPGLGVSNQMSIIVGQENDANDNIYSYLLRTGSTGQ